MAGQLSAEFVEVFFAVDGDTGRVSAEPVEVFLAVGGDAGRVSSALVEVSQQQVPSARLASELVEVFLVPLGDVPPVPGPPGTGTAPSTFQFAMLGFQPPPSPRPNNYLRGATAYRSVEYVRQPGSGAGQIRAIRAADVELGPSVSTTIDLVYGADPYGFRLDLVDAVVVLVENVAGGAGGAVELRPAAVEGFTDLLGAGSAVVLPAGSAALFFVASRDGDGWPVAPTGRKLSVVEVSAVGARVVAHVWGRRAS